MVGYSLSTSQIDVSRVVSRFLSSRFHPKSRGLFLFYFSNITLRIDLLTFRVTDTVFKIASEMRQLPVYFDNPVSAFNVAVILMTNCIITLSKWLWSNKWSRSKL